MKISNGIKIIDLGLLFKNSLIIADVHIGYEEALNKQGIFVPRFQFGDFVKRIESIFLKLGKKIERVIINGDIKHEFGIVSEQEWRQTLRFIDQLLKHCNEVVLIKGNHDKIIGPIAGKRNLKVVEQLIIGKTIIIHGDKIPKKINNIDRVIIAHEHPAISIKEGVRAELFKCFLKGKWKGKEIIVQPSFNLITEGTDILKEKLLSPFLKQDLSKFEAFIVADRVYDFGKLGKLNGT